MNKGEMRETDDGVQFEITGKSLWDIALNDDKWEITKYLPNYVTANAKLVWDGDYRPQAAWTASAETFNIIDFEDWLAEGPPRLGKRRADQIIKALMGLHSTESA